MKATIGRYFSMLKTANTLDQRCAYMAVLFAMVLSVVPAEAMAQSLNIPFIDGVGCQVANWMKGPLAILIFIVVCIATLVIGLITKMDWGRMISVAIVFGIIQGLVTILLSTGSITLPSCLAS